MGQKLSELIGDIYKNAPPPNIEGVQYSDIPDTTPASQTVVPVATPEPKPVVRPPVEEAPPPALIEGVVGHSGEGAEAAEFVGKRVAGGALGAAAAVAELPADIAESAYDFVAQGRIAKATGLSEHMKGYGITDKYREIFVDPAKRASLQLTQDDEVTTSSEKLFGALTSGAGHMGVQLTTDKMLGNAIVGFITKRNPVVGALLIATKSRDQLARIIPDWVIGMSARRGAEHYNDTKDLVAAGASMVEAAAEGQVMHLIPTSPIKGAAGWAAFGAGSRFKEDLKRDELSSWDEYKFSTAESVGFHLAFMTTRTMSEQAQTPVEKAYTKSILSQLEQDGAVDIRKLKYIINDPTTSPEMQKEAGRLEMILADERALSFPELLADLEANRATLETVPPEPSITNNASGESAASVEALNRVVSEKASGKQRYKIDVRTKKIVPIFGVDAVDMRATNPFDIIIQDGVGKEGGPAVLSRGKSISPETEKLAMTLVLGQRTPIPKPSNWDRFKPDYAELGDVHRSAANEIQAKMDAGELHQEDAQTDKSWKMWFQDKTPLLFDQRGTVGPDIGPREPRKMFERVLKEEPTEEYIARMDALLGKTGDDVWKAAAEQRFNVGQKVKAHDRDNYGEVVEEKINPVTKEAIYTVRFVSPKGDEAIVQFTPETLSPIGKDGKPKQTGPLDPNRPGRHITDMHARRVVEALHALDQGRAYEDVKNAGALNFHNMGSNEEALRVLAQIHDVASEVIEPTREMGQTLPGIHRTAMGMTPTLDKIRTWYMGTKNLAQKITAARISLLWSATRLAELKIKTMTEGATPEDAAELAEWSKTHINMQELVEGSISNIARGLGALRIKIEAKDIMGASSPEEVIKIMSRHKAGATNRVIAGWLELYKGWMFSNPGTHITNTAGNLAVQIGNTAEDYIAATLGRVRMADASDRVMYKEAHSKLAGRMVGWQLSSKYMVDLVKASADVYSEARATGKGHVESARLAEDALNLKGLAPYENKYNEDTRSFTSTSLLGKPAEDQNFGVLMGRTGLDLLGMSSRSPLTALGLEDNYFREVSYTASISGIAIRESFKETMTDQQRKDFVSGFIKAHTMLLEGNLRAHSNEEQKQIEKYAKDGRFHEEAYDQAAKDVFANDFSGDGAVPNLLEAGRLFLQKTPLAQVLWPTYKTPWHILHYITQRTPVLNALSWEYRQEMKAGGRRRDMAVAKMVYGSMLYTLGASLYLNGDIMPDTDKDLKGSAKALGVRRDSILFRGKAYEVGGADPFGSFLALSARIGYLVHNTVGVSNTGDLNLFDQTYDTNGNLMQVPLVGAGGQGWKPAEAMSYGIMAFSSLFFDKSVLRQVKDTMNFTSGSPGSMKSGTRMLSRVGVGLTLPFNGAFRFANSFDNKYMRDAEGFVDQYLAQAAPGNVKPVFDIFGEPVPSMQKWGWFIPQSLVNPTHSPIRALIMKLELPVAGILDSEWRGLQLTEEQGVRLNELVAEGGLEDKLNRLIERPSFQQRKDSPGSIGYNTKGDAILTYVRAARRQAHARLNREEKAQGQSLTDQIREKKRNIRNDEPSRSTGWEKLTDKFD
jgi:hypothetical protein